jgi:hypothetical protein
VTKDEITKPAPTKTAPIRETFLGLMVSARNPEKGWTKVARLKTVKVMPKAAGLH